MQICLIRDTATCVRDVRSRSGKFYYETQLIDKVKDEFGRLFKEELKAMLIDRMQKLEFKA